MHPKDCPAWEYKDFPNSELVLKRQAHRILVALRVMQEEACGTTVHDALILKIADVLTGKTP